MYNLAPANAPWFEHLTDSVRALGEAAREWQLADRAAALAEEHVRLESRSLHEGKATHRPTSDAPGRPYSVTPHANAVFELGRVYMDYRFRTQREYCHAALLFASGAAWAIAEVQAGGQPDRVVFDLEDGELPEALPHPYRVEGLGPYSEAGKVARAYDRLLSMEMAAEHAEDLAGRDYVADHEASDMFDALEEASGIEDAAYTYGLLAERALQFVLLGTKAAHRKQVAEQRAAEQAAAEENGL